MSKTNGELSTKLAARGAAPTTNGFEHAMASWYAGNQKRLTNLWGSEENAKRLFLAFMNAAARNPKIMECTTESIARALLSMSELRIYPGATQEAALVPLNNSKVGRRELNLWVQYPGLVKLAYNSGTVKDISCAVVYEADEFDYQLGTNTFLRHVPFLGSYDERGNRKCVYCCIQTSFGGHQICVLPISFIEGIRKRSPAARASDSPWNSSNPDDYDAMAKKTALRQALKFIPKSTELASALESDGDDPRFTPPVAFDAKGSWAIEDTQSEQEKEQASTDSSGAEGQADGEPSTVV